MTSVTVGSKRGQVFNLKYNGVDFSRVGKYETLNFVKRYTHMNNIHSISNTSNLGVKNPSILFSVCFPALLHFPKHIHYSPINLPLT